MDTQTAKTKTIPKYVGKSLMFLALVALAVFVISLSVTHIVDLLLLILTLFIIVAAIIFFGRIFIWLIGAAGLVTIIFCGIAIIGYIASLFS